MRVYKPKKPPGKVPSRAASEAAIAEYFATRKKHGAQHDARLLHGVGKAYMSGLVHGYSTAEEAVAALRKRKTSGGQPTMPRHLEAVVVRTMVECWQRNSSLQRAEVMRIYYAVATANGYTFKVCAMAGLTSS